MTGLRKVLLAALAVAALLGPALPGTAQATTVTTYLIEPSGGTTQLSVPLDGAAGKVVRFQVDVSQYPAKSIETLVVRIAQGANQTQVQLLSPAARGVGGTIWEGDLAASAPALRKGSHAVTTHITNASGAGTLDNVARTLTGTSADATPPTIRAAIPATGQVRLGRDQDLGILVDDAGTSSGLARVTYRMGSGPALPLEFPYAVRATSLPEGASNVHVTAQDRSGNAASATFQVLVDTVAPTLALTAPADVFVGVPATVVAQASDASPYNVTFLQAGNATSSPATGPKGHTFALRVNATGPGTLRVIAHDVLGNSVERQLNFTARILETDAILQSFEVTPRRPIAGEAVSLRVTLAQEPGFVELPFNVTFTGSHVGDQTQVVPANRTATLVVPLRPAVGLQQITATIAAPVGVIELDPGNQTVVLDYEVFFGRVTQANQTYYIRANEFGLPGSAVSETGQTYPLRLVQDGTGVAYSFQVGSTEVVWDPTPSDAVTDSETDEPGKDAPGPGLWVLVLALLGVALRRRR